VTANSLSSWSRVCSDKEHSPTILEPRLLKAPAHRALPPGPKKDRDLNQSRSSEERSVLAPAFLGPISSP
jgi:hypothetical protein